MDQTCCWREQQENCVLFTAGEGGGGDVAGFSVSVWGKSFPAELPVLQQHLCAGAGAANANTAGPRGGFKSPGTPEPHVLIAGIDAPLLCVLSRFSCPVYGTFYPPKSRAKPTIAQRYFGDGDS